MESLPEPLRAEPIPGGFTVKLPRRDTANSLTPGTFICMSGVSAAGFGIWWFAHCLDWAPGEPRLFKLFALGLGSFGIPGILVGLPLIVGGLWFIIGGAAEFEVSARGIRIRERLGPLFWTRNIPRHRIGKVTVEREEHHDPAIKLSSLMIWIPKRHRPVSLGGYPVPWMEALLKECIKVLGLEPLSSDPLVRSKPWASPIECVSDNRGLTLTVPPKGFGCAVLGSISFGFLWITLIVMGFAKADIPVRSAMGLLEGCFVLVGIGFILAGLHVARQRVRITATPTCIRVEEGAAFWTRTRQWARSTLLGWGVAELRWRENDDIRYELRFRLSQGKVIGILPGRPKDELEWISGILYAAGASSPGASPTTEPAPK